MILLSPIVSGLRLVMDNYDNQEIDVFCNDNKISKIACPIFVIHGKKDEIIKYKHCLKMAKKIKHLKEWYPSEGNHNNIIERFRVKFYLNCKDFISQLKRIKRVDDENDDFNFSHFHNFSFQSKYCEENDNVVDRDLINMHIEKKGLGVICGRCNNYGCGCEDKFSIMNKVNNCANSRITNFGNKGSGILKCLCNKDIGGTSKLCEFCISNKIYNNNYCAVSFNSRNKLGYGSYNFNNITNATNNTNNISNNEIDNKSNNYDGFIFSFNNKRTNIRTITAITNN